MKSTRRNFLRAAGAVMALPFLGAVVLTWWLGAYAIIEAIKIMRSFIS